MEQKEVKMVVADPAGLGLFGLAMVTLVASSQKLGWTSGTSFVLPWAIFLGSFAQLVAALLDAKRNNTFGTVAFGAYSFFWLGVGMTWLTQHGVFGESMQANGDIRQLGVAFIGYLIFSFYMTIAALRTTKVLFSILVLIDFLFIGLILSTLQINGLAEFGHTLAAWVELVIALLSFYGSAAAVLNTHFGYTFLPLGKPFNVFVKK